MDLLEETRRLLPIYTVGAVLPGATHVINVGTVQAYRMADQTLIIPGTNSFADWMAHNLNGGVVTGTDIQWEGLDKAVGNALWYRGFAHHARILFDALDGWRPRQIVGHSLGAASAQILGSYFGVPTLALASPRPRYGTYRLKNEGFVLNVIYNNDLVVWFPSGGQYRPVGSVEVMAPVPGKGSRTHSVAEYLPLMEAEMDAGTLRRHFP